MKNKLIKVGLMCMTLGSLSAYAVPSLYLNFIESNKHVDSKVMNYYKVKGFAGDVIESKISNLSADADLYVKIGSVPTTSSKDCKSTNGSTKIDSCEVTLSEDADVYVGVYGYKEADYAVKATLKDTKVKTINYNQDIFGITPRLEHRDYKIHANAGDVLKIRAYDMDADGDLYVKLGSKARRGSGNNLASSHQNGLVDEEVTIEIDNDTDVYIGLYADKSCIHTVEHHIKVTRSNAVEEITVLNSGEADSGSVALKKWKYFKIHALAGDTVKGILNGLDADADLYVKVGEKPTKGNRDCRSTIGKTAVDSCAVTVSKNADVYIGVFGYKATDFNIRANVQSNENNYGKKGSSKVKRQPDVPEGKEKDGPAVYYPKGISKNNPTPLVLFAAGWSSKNSKAYRSLLKFIASHGYSVLYVPGSYGNSENSIKRFEKALKDLDILSYVDTSRIGVIGHSSGGGATFKILDHFSKKGYGNNGRFIMALDPWYATFISESEIQNLPSNTNVSLIQFGNDATGGTDIDAIVPLKEYSLLTSINNSKKDYKIVPNGTHGYASGSKPYTSMQGVLKPLDALMDYTFNNNQSAHHTALEQGSDTPYHDKLQLRLNESYYEGYHKCKPTNYDDSLSDYHKRHQINYCNLDLNSGNI